MNIYRTLMTGLFLFCAVSPVSAKELVASRSISPAGQDCKMIETANLGINFNNTPIDLTKAKTFMQEKADEVLNMAKDLGIEEIFVQNVNYNIYSNNYNGCSQSTPSNYQLNGNVSFQMPNAEHAEKLMEAIGDKGYNVNFNMNAYRQCQ